MADQLQPKNSTGCDETTLPAEVACCLCSGVPMLIQLVLGMMNPLAMIGVAIVIAAEKILSRPELTARLVGTAAIFAGVTTTLHKLNQ